MISYCLQINYKLNYTTIQCAVDNIQTRKINLNSTIKITLYQCRARKTKINMVLKVSTSNTSYCIFDSSNFVFITS